MTNQDFNEDLDEQDISSNDGEEQGENGEETTPNKKNKSNFKALYNKTRELEKELASRDENIATMEAELEEWRNLNPDLSDDLKWQKDFAKMQEEIFYVKNPDAENYAKEINKTIKEYNLPNDKVWLTKAWKLVKSEIPEESITKTDFKIWKSNISNKNLKDVTPEEALELSKEKKSEWRKLNWFAG